MTSEELDRMDATARDGSRWPESTQSLADVLALTAEVRRLAAERDGLREALCAAVAERDALRAIVEGRAVAPTQEERLAHSNRDGHWIVADHDGSTGLVGGLGAAIIDDNGGAAHWWPIDRDGRPCAWPVVAQHAEASR